MADLNFKINGLDELLSNLEQLPKNVANRSLRKGLTEGAKVMGKEVKGRIPVGPPSKHNAAYGHLRDSIGFAVTIPRDGYHGYARIGFGKNEHLARWIEFGHQLVGHKPDKKPIDFIGAQPMLRPGFDASKENALKAFAVAVKQAVDKAGKKGGK